MIGIIQTGGKQYKVSVGDKVKIEKVAGEAGAEIKLDLLFAGDDKSVLLGTPMLKEKAVAKILRQDRADKVTGIKHKAKKRELTRYGHRQAYTEVEITKISA